MTDNQEFEDIIKSKFSEQEFPFDEANWDEAEEMIYSFRKRERIKKFAITFSAGLILGILIMLPFVLVKKEDITSPVVITDDNIAYKQRQDEKLQKQNIKPKDATPKPTLNEGDSKTDDLAVNDKPVNVAAISNVNKSNDLKTGVKEQKQTISNASKITNEKQTEDIGAEESSIPDVVAEIANIIVDTTSKIVNENERLVIDSLVTADSMLVVTDSLLAAFDSTIVADSVVSANGLVEKDSIKNKKLPRRTFVEAYVGGNYARGFGLNSYNGISVYFPVSDKFSLGTGAGYTTLSSSSNVVKTIITDIKYDLGYTSEVTEIKTDKIHYLMIPVHIQFNADEKSALLIGAVNYFMTTVSNTYSTYKESYGEKNNINSQKTYGYSSGINVYDIALVVGCKRTLFNNLGLAAYFNYGLTDIKKDSYYNDNRFDRNISGQLVLTYKLR